MRMTWIDGWMKRGSCLEDGYRGREEGGRGTGGNEGRREGKLVSGGLA